MVAAAWLLMRQASAVSSEPASTAALWRDLGDADAAKAYRAMQRLAQAPRETVAFPQGNGAGGTASDR
jgi:hypothetical protein